MELARVSSTRAVHSYILIGFDSPALPRKCLGGLLKVMRWAGQLATAHLERHLWSGVDPEVPRILDELKRQGLLLAVISNTEDGRLTDSLGAAGIADRFDLLLDSYLVGHRKPDAAIFRLALERLNLAPDEAAYVGDSYVHDALAARAVGLRGILLDPMDLHPESVCPRVRSLSELIEPSS